MTFVKNADNILIGTGRVFIDGSCVGQISGQFRAKVGNTWYTVEAGFPSSKVKQALTGESGEVAFNLLEIDLDVIRSIMPQFAEYTEEAGESADFVSEVVPIYPSKHTKLGNSRITTLDSVKTVADTPATLVEGTDYYFDRLNGTLYMISTSVAVESGDSVTVKYKHATFTGAGFGVGGGTTTSDTFLVEFWHKKTNGKYLCKRFWKCQVAGDFEMLFEEAAHTTLPVLLTVLSDSTKPAGHQLYRTIEYDASAAPEGGW